MPRVALACFAFALSLAALPAGAQAAEPTRPFIWVNDGDRPAVLQKIADEPWAAELFETMKSRVEPHVSRHETDPDWILGRIPLTWGGNHHTDFAMERQDGVSTLVQTGHAEHPTVRFMLGRLPRNQAGNRVDQPTLEEIIPFNPHPSGGMELVDRVTQERTMVEDLDRYHRHIGRTILEHAVDSAVLYWLTQEPRYAAFSADVLSLYCEALAPMNANPKGGHNWGLITNNHLLEARWFSNLLPIIYDFVAPHLQHAKVYDPVTKQRRAFGFDNAQAVFAKYIDLAVNRGILNCNWVVFESASLANSALALDDPEAREAALAFFYTQDTRRQQSLKTFMTFFTEDAAWFESLSYGNETVGFATYLLTLADRHRPTANLVKKHAVLFDAVHILPRFRFPNGEYLSFGDSHRDLHVESEALEKMHALALKHGFNSEAVRLEGVLNELIQNGEYERSSYAEQRYVYTRPLKLLWFSPQLTSPATPLELTRTDALAHAGIVLQRNGEDPETALMGWQGGAHYVHAHAHGMDMELFGLGEVLGAEGGRSQYGSEIHEQYYRVYAAHNTVVVNNASRGIGGWENIGQETARPLAVEPAPRQPAVSPDVSFATLGLNSHHGPEGELAPQQRTLAVIRTGEDTGYYLDVFRSRTANSGPGDAQFHDYLYHNIGDELRFDESLTLEGPAGWYGSDIGDEHRQPGTRWFEEKDASGPTDRPVEATFHTTLKESAARTRVWFPGGIERRYASVMAPPTLESPRPYDKQDTPVLIARRQGEAWDHPFEAVFEMFTAQRGPSIRKVERVDAGPGVSLVRVASETLRGPQEQVIFSADRASAEAATDTLQVRGRFAVCSRIDGELEYVYLGEAQEVRVDGWWIRFADGQPGAAEVRFGDAAPDVTSARELLVTRP